MTDHWTDGLGVRAGAGESPDARIGAVVDRYTIVRLLGKGGMGAVYEARDAKLSRRFAIKFLLPEFAANPDILRRFKREAKALGKLEHENLTAVTDIGSAPDGAPYLVMEFLQGEDCSKLIRRAGPLPFPRATDIVRQACRGLAVAHRAGIIHRDLKPENIFLADAGDGSDLVKVLDFGIAKLRSAEGSLVTGTGTTFGTAYYMSPEQARGASEVDERTDVWSLGIVLYELMSGHKPFQGDQFLYVIHSILSLDPPRLVEFSPNLPRALVDLVQRAMAKDISQRMPTVSALADALAPFARRESTGQTPAAASLEATLPTPATAVRPSAKSNAGGDTRAIPALGDASARSFPKWWVGMGVAAAAAAVVATALPLVRPTRHAERLQYRPSAETGSELAHPAPPGVGLPTPAARAPSPPPVNVGSSAPVRSLSEQSEHNSNRAASPTLSTRRVHKTTSAVATTPAKPPLPPAPAAQAARPEESAPDVNIDPRNPYK